MPAMTDKRPYLELTRAQGICEPRWATPRTGRRTLGRAAAKVARLLGQPLLPWQRQVVDVALEVEADGRPAYRDVILTCPRQQGKSTLLLALILTRALLEPRSNTVYLAQSALDAKKKWSDEWVPRIEGSLLGSQVSVRRAPGREGLLFANGSRQSIVASTEKAGHGEVIDFGILDEAFAYQDARVEQALRPAMMTRPAAQFWVTSTAGTPDRSPYLWERVQAGRQAVEAGIRTGLCFFEWSAEDQADPADPETWRRCMPALGLTVDEETVRAAQLSMGRHEFARAFLNRWVATMGDPLISMEHWQSLGDPGAPRPEWVVFGVDVAPQGRSAAIVAVGERDDDLQAAVLEHGTGSDWVIPALGRLLPEYGNPRLLVDGKACRHLLPELERVSGFRVTELAAGEIPPACAFWLKLAQEGRIKHRGEHELAVALDGAGQRALGDGWAWSRRNSGADITPLVALTLAASFWHGSWGAV